MKSLFITILFTFIITGAIAQKLPKNFSSDTIIWKQDSLLTKENFKGKPKGNIPAFACTGIFLHMEESDGTLKFYVEAIFSKSKSFMKESSVYTLKHEQLHFDIAELCARKFRKALSEKDFRKVKNLREEINKMSTKSGEDMKEEQNKYDTDTEHGLNAAKQEVWIKNIAERLKELDAYSSTEVDIVK